MGPTSSPIIKVMLAWLFVFVFGCGGAVKRATKTNDFDVIVVGSGLGGLTAGTKLARAGFKVVILEQHYKVGGCNTSFSRGEFKFDVALHQLSLGSGDGIGREVLEQIGVLDRIELIQAPELARSVYPGIDFVAPNDEKEMIAALKQKWPKEKEGIDEFFKLAVTISEEIMELSELYRANAFVAGLKKLMIPFKQSTLYKWRNSTLSDVLDHFFTDERLKAVISQHWLYFGPPPSKVWAPGFLLGYYSYVKNGAWQIKGSSQSLSNAAEASFKEAGGVLFTTSRVSKISTEENRVTGVVIDDGRTISSRYVISNAGPYQTFFELVGRDKFDRDFIDSLDSMKPSNSLVGVYLGLDVELSFFGVEEYEVFYHTELDAGKMYAAMMEGRFDQGAVSITLYSNLEDNFYAPEGKSAIVLNAYSDISYWPPRGEEYYELKEKMMGQLIELAEQVLPGLAEHIVIKEAMTPRTIYSYTLHRDGVPYGFDLVPEQWGGIQNTTPIEGLYLAGSWANILHGTGGAIISGYKAARLVMDAENMD